MQTLKLENVALSAVCACLPPTAEDSLARCTALYGDPVRAENVVKATGIRRRRLAPEGVSSLDLCTQAAERLLTDAAQARGQPLDAVRASIGAVLCVTFTPARAMPCNACQAQRRLGLGNDVIAFDIGLACSGYAYGLYMAGLLARQTGKDVLLLDGDVQSPRLDPNDAATVPVLADAGTASLVSPVAGSAPWRFAFMSKGEDGDALALPHDGLTNTG